VIPRLAALLALLCLVAASVFCGAADSVSPKELLLDGRTDAAIRLLQERIHSAPRDAEAYHLLTRTYFYMQRWDDAAAAAEKAVALDSANSDYQLWLARAVGEKAEHSSFVTAVRMVPKIRNAFERAVQLNGSSVEARTDLAEFYMEAPAFLGGGKDKALAQARALAALDEAAAHWVKARLAEHAKQYDVAEQEYRAAISSSKQPGPRWLDLAGFYRQRGRFDQMEEAVRQATAQDPPLSSVPYDAALLLFHAGRDFPQAITLLRQYLAAGPQPESAPAYQAYYLLAEILEKQGDRQAAAAEYRAAISLAHQFEPAQAGLRRVSQQ
jgi:tetratricopeptide (TPR) repeat protein